MTQRAHQPARHGSSPREKAIQAGSENPGVKETRAQTVERCQGMTNAAVGRETEQATEGVSSGRTVVCCLHCAAVQLLWCRQ